MSDSNPGDLYEPLIPPLEKLTSTNRGPIVLATGTTLLIITGLTVLVKIWTRLATTRNLGLNDYAILGSLVRDTPTSFVFSNELMCGLSVLRSVRQ